MPYKVIKELCQNICKKRQLKKTFKSDTSSSHEFHEIQLSISFMRQFCCFLNQIKKDYKKKNDKEIQRQEPRFLVCI
jgi:hypothetical protein